MALSCPNKSLPEWKRLVDEVGEREALNDYFQFGTIRSPYAVKDKLERLNIANYTNRNFKIGERYFKPTVESLIDVEKNSSVVDAMVTHFGYRGLQSEEDLIKRKFTDDIRPVETVLTQPTTTTTKSQITEGVADLFESNPELANIGTQQLYSQYIEQIFPNSKVKDIVYHGGSKTFEEFVIDSENRASGTSQVKKGIYLTRSKKVAEDYKQSREGITNGALSIILDRIEKSLGLKEYKIFGNNEDGYANEEDGYKKPSEVISKLEKLYGKLTKDNLYYFSEEGLSDYSYMNQLKDFKNLNIDSLIDAMRTDDIEKIKSIISEYQSTNKDTSKLYSVIVNLKNPTIISNKEVVPMYNSLIGKESLINESESVIVENVDDSVRGNMREPSDTIIVFDPEQTHILGSQKDIEGFKEFVSNENNTQNVQYQLPQGREMEEFVASEKTIRDLAARMSDRIGIPVKYISDRSQQFKGKLENGTAVINLAYATLDTPIHEILGHPIIRTIKGDNILRVGDTVNYSTILEKDKTSKIKSIIGDKYNLEDGNSFEGYELNKVKGNLYQNLLKELEYDKGKEVLDRVKRDYHYKGNLEIYESSGWWIIKDNNDSEKNFGRYGSKEMATIAMQEELEKQSKYTLEEQQEEAIVELLGLMTAEKLDAVKDGKLISLLKRLLKEIKAFVRDLLNQREVEIDKLPDNMTLGDIADLLAYSNSKLILPGNEVIYTTPDNQQFKTYAEASKHISDLAKSVEDVDLSNIKSNNIEYFYNVIDTNTEKTVRTFLTEKEALIELELYDNNSRYVIRKDVKYNPLQDFVEKNKEYEQSKEIIEEWKKVNNIQYNPEEIYSRGQEFVSVVGAYSAFDVDLMMQNLLQHIEDNQKAGGEFTISAFTKPIDRLIPHLEGGGGKIKFKIYPQSKDIKWAANTDVFSGSVWDASEKVSKDKKSELLGVSYTKYPSLETVNAIKPNLASIIDDLSYHHNELGISLTGNNFRLEYDKDIPYSTKKIIDSINSILDQKYGKLVKPEIKEKLNKKDLGITFIGEVPNETGGSDGWWVNFNNGESKGFNTKKELDSYINSLQQNYAIQPTQTNETLKESIEGVKNKIQSEFKDSYFNEYYKDGYRYVYLTEYDKYSKQKDGELIDITKEEYERNKPKKEYTSQALINTKIAKLKEVAKKYPRSLIRSEVRPINSSPSLGFTEGELPFQKIGSKQDIEGFKEFVTQPTTQSVKSGVSELFESNPELANEIYEALGFNFRYTSEKWKDDPTTENKATYINIKGTPSNQEFQIKKDIEDGFYSVHFKTEQGKLTKEQIQTLVDAIASQIPIGGKLSTWGNITNGGISGLNRFLNNGFKKVGEREIKDIDGNPIVIPILEKVEKSNLEQQAQQQYSQYLDTIFPDSKVKDIVYHGKRTDDIFDKFDTSKKAQALTGKHGIYFSEDKDFALGFTTPNRKKQPVNPKRLLSVLLNIKNPRYTSNVADYFKITDEVKMNLYEEMKQDGAITTNKEIVVFEPEQIHILGSKQDIEGFKKFVSKSIYISNTYHLGYTPTTPTQEQIENKQKECE